ncbi:tyrosine-protein phosphatase [Xanthobacter sp. TB0139]|uniref:tyrosine-protein phosphatase n=1 Tax=Xanthobacter sp. TB0139 TaxID=3459178 RepID=UPI00403A4699
MTSSPSYERFLALPGIFNLRDLGGYAAETQPTAWRRFLRSDSPHRIGEEGIQKLLDEGVRMVIDLRGHKEVANAPNPFAQMGEAMDRPPVIYRHVSLFSGLAPQAQPSGDLLQELYLQALHQRAEVFTQVLTDIATAPAGTVLFHCTAGKDRTGLVAALLLSLVGVEPEIIISDYALTEHAITPLLAELEAEATKRGADPALLRPFMACNSELLTTALEQMSQQYGSAEAYLLAAGMSGQNITRLKARLLD